MSTITHGLRYLEDGEMKLICKFTLEEISPQNGPPKKFNKIIVKIIK